MFFNQLFIVDRNILDLAHHLLKDTNLYFWPQLIQTALYILFEFYILTCLTLYSLAHRHLVPEWV